MSVYVSTMSALLLFLASLLVRAPIHISPLLIRLCALTFLPTVRLPHRGCQVSDHAIHLHLPLQLLLGLLLHPAHRVWDDLHLNVRGVLALLEPHRLLALLPPLLGQASPVPVLIAVTAAPPR